MFAPPRFTVIDGNGKRVIGPFDSYEEAEWAAYGLGISWPTIISPLNLYGSLRDTLPGYTFISAAELQKEPE